MDKKEFKMLVKAEKQIYDAMQHELKRQAVINCFLISRLPESEIAALEKEVLQFDEDNKPESFPKE